MTYSIERGINAEAFMNKALALLMERLQIRNTVIVEAS